MVGFFSFLFVNESIVVSSLIDEIGKAIALLIVALGLTLMLLKPSERSFLFQGEK
jgi:hypothetical protein